MFFARVIEKTYLLVISDPEGRFPIARESVFIVTHSEVVDNIAIRLLASTDPRLLIVRSRKNVSPKSANPLLFPEVSLKNKLS
jgi:hypothetical protein